MASDKGKLQSIGQRPSQTLLIRLLKKITWLERRIGSYIYNIGSAKAVYDYTAAKALNQTYINVTATEKIEAGFDDATLGGVHAHVFIEDVKKWFVFTRSAATKLYIYDDIVGFTSPTIIDISEGDYDSGIDSYTYNPKTRMIYFSYNDGTYSIPNTLVKSVNVDTLAVATVIDYNTGIVPAFPIVASDGDYIYTAEGNYGFKINKFTTAGVFVEAISPTTPIGSNAAHGWVMDEGNLYVSTHITYVVTQSIIKIDLDTFTVVQQQEYTLLGANTGTGGGGFTNQIGILGNYIYLGQEKSTIKNEFYQVNKNDLSVFQILDVYNSTDLSSFYFAKSFNGLVYYGGEDDMIGSYNPENGINVNLENPFTYSINQISCNRDTLLYSGFDVYPVDNTGYVGQGKFFKQIETKIL
jgi:hypothetical protein